MTLSRMTLSRNALITTIWVVSVLGGLAFGVATCIAIEHQDWGGAMLFFGFYVLCCFYLWQVPKLRSGRDAGMADDKRNHNTKVVKRRIGPWEDEGEVV